MVITEGSRWVQRTIAEQQKRKSRSHLERVGFDSRIAEVSNKIPGVKVEEVAWDSDNHPNIDCNKHSED